MTKDLMAWSSGGNDGGDNTPVRGPWGRGPERGGNGSGRRPPDFEALLQRLLDRLRLLIPKGLGANGLIIGVIAIVGLWIFSGVYFVGPDEQGVVLRFGRYSARTSQGPNYHLPWPIETAYVLKVTTANQTNIGYKPTSESTAENPQYEDVPDESLMLTGDENIVDINFSVYWQIKDPEAYLFRVEKPDDAVKAVAESAMREVVGQNQIEPILTSDRETIQNDVRELMQKTLDEYGAGVIVTSVQMQKVEPPEDVRAAYLDVQSALADQDRKRNEAEADANRIIPQARGDAAHIVQDAEAYKQQAIATATGEAKRFLSVLTEYRKAPEVTRKRMYLETMSAVLAPMNKVIVDDSAKGVVPYFQLPSMLRQPGPQPQQSPAPATPRQGPAPQASSGDAQ